MGTSKYVKSLDAYKDIKRGEHRCVHCMAFSPDQPLTGDFETDKLEGGKCRRHAPRGGTQGASFRPVHGGDWCLELVLPTK